MGQLFTKHQDALLAFFSKYIVVDKTAKCERVKVLRARGAEHKTSHPDISILPIQYWLKDVDKCLAIDWGVNIFVVSTEAIDVTVIKYLSSASAPGYISINLVDMGLSDLARGEYVVCDDIVLIKNESHYNALTWPRSYDHDDDTHEEDHFDNEFGD